MFAVLYIVQHSFGELILITFAETF